MRRAVKSHLLGPLAVLTAPLLLALVVPALHAQQPPSSNRPPGVPADYVITPFGWFHPSCVGAVASGDTVFADGRVQHADGTVDPPAPVCGYLSYTTRGAILTSTVPSASGWIETAHTANPALPGTSFRKLTATWTVPPPPTTTSGGQTLYFFPGLQDTNDPASQPTIIQPVLAWNQGSVRHPDDPGLPGVWSIGSWACCTTDRYPWHSTFRQVQTGDMLDGTMESTCGSGTFTCPTWTITTTDLASGATTVLNTSNWGRTFDWAFEGALEIRQDAPPVNQCTDYPPNGAVTFASVNLYNYNEGGPILDPGWSWDPEYQYHNLDPQCWYGGQVSPTQLTLYYGLYATPATLNFGHHYTDESPVYLTTTVTNHSISQPATIVSIGQNLPAYFLVSNTTCVSTLGAGASCSITVELDLANAPVGTINKTMAIVYQSNTTPPQPARLNVPLLATVSCRFNCFGPVEGP